jgi:hypothetical protein
MKIKEKTYTVLVKDAVMLIMKKNGHYGERHIRRLCKNGILDAKYNGVWLITRESIDEFNKRNSK